MFVQEMLSLELTAELESNVDIDLPNSQVHIDIYYIVRQIVDIYCIARYKVNIYYIARYIADIYYIVRYIVDIYCIPRYIVDMYSVHSRHILHFW